MVYVLLGTGFEEIEAMTPVDLLRRANIPVMTVGISGKTVFGGHKIGVQADILPEEMDLNAMEMLVIPGGLGGVAAIQASPEAMAAIGCAHKNGKYLAAICAGPTVLAGLGITDGKKAVCYPGCEGQMGNAQILADTACVQDGSIITGTSAGCATPFALALIRALKGPEEARRIAAQIVIG